MRTFTSQQQARPEYYDRTPAIQTLSYTAFGLAPHAEVVRFTYTVPAGSKAKIMQAMVMMHRVTVAAPVSRSQIYLQHQPGGAGDVRLLAGTAVTNNVGDLRQMNVGEGLVMVAGDVINGNTADLSTGGQNDFLISASIMQFAV